MASTMTGDVATAAATAPPTMPQKPGGWTAVLAAQGFTLVFVISTAFAFGKRLGEINTQLTTLNTQVAALSDPNNGAIARLIRIETRMESGRPPVVRVDTVRPE